MDEFRFGVIGLGRNVIFGSVVVDPDVYGLYRFFRVVIRVLVACVAVIRVPDPDVRRVPEYVCCQIRFRPVIVIVVSRMQRLVYWILLNASVSPNDVGWR